MYGEDADGDGFGSFRSTIDSCSSTPPLGYVANFTDCSDVDASVYPGMVWYADTDTDGFGDPDVTVNSRPDDCDPPAAVGFVSNDLDCNDGDGAIHPYGVELCDYVDNDCDGLIDSEDAVVAGDGDSYYQDADGDGFGDPRTRTPTAGTKGCRPPRIRGPRSVSTVMTRMPASSPGRASAAAMGWTGTAMAVTTRWPIHMRPSSWRPPTTTTTMATGSTATGAATRAPCRPSHTAPTRARTATTRDPTMYPNLPQPIQLASAADIEARLGGAPICDNVVFELAAGTYDVYETLTPGGVLDLRGAGAGTSLIRSSAENVFVFDQDAVLADLSLETAIGWQGLTANSSSLTLVDVDMGGPLQPNFMNAFGPGGAIAVYDGSLDLSRVSIFGG